MNQFQIDAGVSKALQTYLIKQQIDLKTAMDREAHNNEVAAIIHSGLPTMVKKIYSLEKMQNFFWEKKDLMEGYIAQRLITPDKPKGSKKKKR